MRIFIVAAIALGVLQSLPVAAAQVVKSDYAAYSPIFAQSAKTLDPTELARTCWKGTLTKRGTPWGMTPDGRSTLRLAFSCRVLPWPIINHSSPDGPDNNGRTVGAIAMLYDMFGKEIQDDSAVYGVIAYLQGCSDPVSGLPYDPDSMTRKCHIGQGEVIKNLILMYQYTGDKNYLDWAAKAIGTMRRYGVISEKPGIGQVATYYKNVFTTGEPVNVGSKPEDPTFGGWLHLQLGWNAWAFSKWYEITGDKSSLDFAVALANRLCNSEDPDGDDGSFRPDGSFGGKPQPNTGSCHVHAHTHCLPGLMHLGGQLMRSGQAEKGLKFINQAKSTFDWLYDHARNPDAGSMTGWLGEWLIKATGTTGKSDCEGCTMGDIVQTAVALGAASRLDPSLGNYVNYYDRAEQVFSGELVEQMFQLRPDYLDVMKDCLAKRVDKVMPDASSDAKAQEVEKRYQEGVKTARRMVGQQLGCCGFPDWVNSAPWAMGAGFEPNITGIYMQGCCGDATVRAAHAIWSGTVTGTAKETRVNMAFNRKSPLVDVVSCLPHRGELDVMVKTAKRVLVRVPEWVPKQDVLAYVQKKPVAVKWQGSYVVFAKVSKGQQLTVTYPLRIAQVKETVHGVEYTERWRGNTIVDINPPGKLIPMFQRPQLESERVPQ